MIALGFPPDYQTISLAAANETRNEIQGRHESRERIGPVNTTNLRMNVGERPMASPELLFLQPFQITNEKLAGGLLPSDAKVQLTLEPQIELFYRLG